ncbi:MAG: hypothetical protein ACOYMF_18480 [Bacteroidales bacterium]
MKKLLLRIAKALLFLALIVTATNVNAQRGYEPMAPVGPSDFTFTMRNDAQTSDRTMEFDLYLLDLDATEPFEISTAQAGISVNTAGIENDGALAAGARAQLLKLSIGY